MWSPVFKQEKRAAPGSLGVNPRSKAKTNGIFPVLFSMAGFWSTQDAEQAEMDATRDLTILEAATEGDEEFCWSRKDKRKLFTKAHEDAVGEKVQPKGKGKEMSLCEFALHPKSLTAALTFKCGCSKSKGGTACMASCSPSSVEQARKETFDTPLAGGARKV